MFISRDPIELMGGDNIFAYGPNPTNWIDPLGLKGAYMFQTTKGTCYTGKGPWGRYLASTRQRTKEDKSKTKTNKYDDAIAKGTHIETPSPCSKVSDSDYAEMVEFVAMGMLTKARVPGCTKYANAIASPGANKYAKYVGTSKGCKTLASDIKSDASRLLKKFKKSTSRR